MNETVIAEELLADLGALMTAHEQVVEVRWTQFYSERYDKAHARFLDSLRAALAAPQGRVVSERQVDGLTFIWRKRAENIDHYGSAEPALPSEWLRECADELTAALAPRPTPDDRIGDVVEDLQVRLRAALRESNHACAVVDCYSRAGVSVGNSMFCEEHAPDFGASFRLVVREGA